MIISSHNEYLFIETPHTGSTAISKELVKSYQGKPIVYKHANYHEFTKVASTKQKHYFVFAGVRNPLDEAVSLYSKFLSDHKGNFSNKENLIENGGWVSGRKAETYKLVKRTKSFDVFLRYFYRFIYTSNININKRHCDLVLRFEDLDSSFSEALDQIGISKMRELPVANKTKKKGHFTDYYEDQATRDFAVQHFGPFMKEWGYEFPNEWGDVKVKKSRVLLYKVAKIGRELYSRIIKGGPLKGLRFIRNRVE